MDLDAYFQRIGYSGARAPTLDTLRAIHLNHTQAIAFENLNPMMGWPVRLDLPSLEEKLVRSGRGGYCYEQNGLLYAVLRELGFEVSGLAARVIWSAPEDEIRPRTHMLLRVRIDGEEFVADVGFGGQTLTAPVRLVTDVEQSTPHENFRLVRVTTPAPAAGGGNDGLPFGGDLRLQSWVGGAWKSLYRFDLQPQYEPDYELANYYVSTKPGSLFRDTLRVARPFPGGRVNLANNQLTVHRLGEEPDRKLLTSVQEVSETLQTVFGLTLPPAAELDPALARVCGLPG